MPTADFWNRDYLADQIDDNLVAPELLAISKKSLVSQLVTDIHSDMQRTSRSTDLAEAIVGMLAFGHDRWNMPLTRYILPRWKRLLSENIAVAFSKECASLKFGYTYFVPVDFLKKKGPFHANGLWASSKNPAVLLPDYLCATVPLEIIAQRGRYNIGTLEVKGKGGSLLGTVKSKEKEQASNLKLQLWNGTSAQPIDIDHNLLSIVRVNGISNDAACRRIAVRHSNYYYYYGGLKDSLRFGLFFRIVICHYLMCLLNVLGTPFQNAVLKVFQWHFDRVGCPERPEKEQELLAAAIEEVIRDEAGGIHFSPLCRKFFREIVTGSIIESLLAADRETQEDPFLERLTNIDLEAALLNKTGPVWYRRDGIGVVLDENAG